MYQGTKVLTLKFKLKLDLELAQFLPRGATATPVVKTVSLWRRDRVVAYPPKDHPQIPTRFGSIPGYYLRGKVFNPKIS